MTIGLSLAQAVSEGYDADPVTGLNANPSYTFNARGKNPDRSYTASAGDTAEEVKLYAGTFGTNRTVCIGISKISNGALVADSDVTITINGTNLIEYTHTYTSAIELEAGEAYGYVVISCASSGPYVADNYSISGLVIDRETAVVSGELNATFAPVSTQTDDFIIWMPIVNASSASTGKSFIDSFVKSFVGSFIN